MGKELEHRVEDAYRQLGARKVDYDVELAGHQVDMYVELETSDGSLQRIAVEVNDYTSPVGVENVRNFSGTVDRLRRERLIDQGIIVSAAGFTGPARNAANINGITLQESADLDGVIAETQAAGRTRPTQPSTSTPSIPSFGHPQLATMQTASATPAEPTKDSSQAISLSKQTEDQYDVFISYSHADQEWVQNELLLRLERAGLKVIIDYRDFSPGAQLLTEIERAVLESRKMVMVLTPAYLSSKWTEFERNLAYSLDPAARRRRLLPVILRRCQIPLHIQSLICIDLRSPHRHEAEIQRLIEAITADVATHSGVDVPSSTHIPAGPFWMGSPLEDAEAHDNEKPRRKLDLREYQIGRYPVTNAQYACFVRDTGHREPKHWDKGQIPAGLEDHPVVNVSHEDAEAYCRWLSQVTGKHYCLPAEEEWEKAARGELPEARRYPWGDKWQPDLCNTQEMGRNGTTSVHEFERINKSSFKVVDMAGNVWEWTASWYARYPGSLHESLRYGRLYRVVRGGSWRNSHREARISCRGQYKPDTQRPYLGFRIVSD